jgi:hypothetical protein
MATIVHTSDAPEARRDTRAEASLRLTVRLELAEMLQRIIPPLISTLGEEGDPDLLPTEAREASLDLLDELESRGYAIVREARS